MFCQVCTYTIDASLFSGAACGGVEIGNALEFPQPMAGSRKEIVSDDARSLPTKQQEQNDQKPLQRKTLDLWFKTEVILMMERRRGA